MDILIWLENWFLQNCDIDWEHSYGLRIATLDNPGWSVEISLNETNLEEKEYPKTIIERSNNDWIHCFVEENTFKGYGGPNNLREILEIFKNWASIHA